jgi:hypothetical protein
MRPVRGGALLPGKITARSGFRPRSAESGIARISLC